MMERIRFNLIVFAVPVVPGRPGADERLVRPADVGAGRYLPTVRRVDPLGPLCDCGARGQHIHGRR